MFYVIWNESEKMRLNTVAEVDTLLDELHSKFLAEKKPTLVTVTVENGDSLSIGLGSAKGVLSFIRASQNPPYYVSVGHVQSEPISFWFGGEWSEFPPHNAIPLDIARLGMHSFCFNGDLSKNVQWEEA